MNELERAIAQYTNKITGSESVGWYRNRRNTESLILHTLSGNPSRGEMSD
jgi:hypothetical protein